MHAVMCNRHICSGLVFSLEIFGQRLYLLFMSLLTPVHSQKSIIVYTTSSVVAACMGKERAHRDFKGHMKSCKQRAQCLTKRSSENAF